MWNFVFNYFFYWFLFKYREWWIEVRICHKHCLFSSRMSWLRRGFLEIIRKILVFYVFGLIWFGLFSSFGHLFQFLHIACTIVYVGTLYSWLFLTSFFFFFNQTAVCTKIWPVLLDGFIWNLVLQLLNCVVLGYRPFCAPISSSVRYK